MNQLLKHSKIPKSLLTTPKAHFSSQPKPKRSKVLPLLALAGGAYGAYAYMNWTGPYESTPESTQKTDYDAIIMGAGHNGLVAANYLAKAGLKVGVFEKRHTVGGAAVTEEIFPGFKFSRASYLAGLLRPDIIKELDLKNYGIEFLFRDPYSFTPHKDGKRYLILGTNHTIDQFSKKDAEIMSKYEDHLGKLMKFIPPLIDNNLPSPDGSYSDKFGSLQTAAKLVKIAMQNKDCVLPFYDLLTAPASQFLNKWFESDILIATLATDAIIGSMTSPMIQGSSYVLLHHIMGSIEGHEGSWAYVRGGMGSITQALAKAAREKGVEIFCNSDIDKVILNQNKAKGILLANGKEVTSKVVLSNATPEVTFKKLVDPKNLPEDFNKAIDNIDYSCGAMKINLVVDKLPDFTCLRNKSEQEGGPQHMGTIHFENSLDEIDLAFKQAYDGLAANPPCVEMTIPSAHDNTLAKPGYHIVQLFIQYAPYEAHGIAKYNSKDEMELPLENKDNMWNNSNAKEAYKHVIYDRIEEFAPGFKSSIVHEDVLTPWDLEQIFGLTKGNIFHGSLNLNQLLYQRPTNMHSNYETPIKGLYLCGSGAHPGGGVMGAPGKNCAIKILQNRAGIKI